MTEGWLNVYKGGKNLPTSRVTVQRMTQKLLNYDLKVMNSTTLQGSGKFATMPFGQASRPVELQNLQSVQWSRNLGQFTAEGTVTLTNTEALAVGVLSDEGEFERPGSYTYQRGDSAEGNTRWGHSKNSRNGLVVPDRLIHIYQGYGTDSNYIPEADPYLVKTFTGLIDTVTLNTDKSLTIAFRDISRVLLDTIYWPDVVSWGQYGQSFYKRQLVDGEPYTVSSTSGKWIHPKYQTDSNVDYIGRGFDDGGRPYVQSNGGVNGHLGKHAFDSSKGSYFLSVGNYARWSSAYEYVQGTFKTGSVTKVKVKAYGGPYTGYISLYCDGEWKGHSNIPYRSRVVDTGADIRFVKRFHIAKGESKTIKLPKVYANCTKIRITFADLWDSNVGNYQYRAGIADVQVFKSNTLDTEVTPKVPAGNIEDYTGIIAWILAWGGFHWPKDSSNFSFVTQSDGTKVNYVHDAITTYYNPPLNTEPMYKSGNWYYRSGGLVIPHGRIWGDLQMTGTTPFNALEFDLFDKQPLSDCIARVKEIVGFNFFIDESGGAVWRSPNIRELGNYISGNDGGPNAGRTSSYVTIDERTTLLGLSTQVSSRNVRERVAVGNTTGKYGAITEGYNPYPSNLRRYGVWTDTNFESLEEAKIMADLIAIRQFMTYRQSTISIAANPAIQIDDQVKIYEKVTSDTYFHYVTGISSNHDIASGRWTYDLTTSWLGTDPATKQWVVDQDKLDALTKKYLKNLGGIN
jgi:hypothetical protein